MTESAVDANYPALLRSRLVQAFALSVVIHIALYGGWRAGQHLGLWDYQATWLMDLFKSKKKMVAVPKPPPPPPPDVTKEIPLAFMEVDPEVAVAEPPKDAKYYGAANALAANPDPKLDTPVPKTDGKQEQVPRMADVPREKPFPLEPTPPPEPKPLPKEEPPPPELVEPTPKLVEDPTEFAKTRLKEPILAEPPKRETPVEKKPEPRPRTLEEARRRLKIPGEIMRQDGGTQRRGTLGFDVRGTEFGAYDAAFIAAVQKRWYDLLDNTPFAQRAGKVVIEFRLTFDGRITDIRTEDNEVGEILGLLCQRAILDPAPYAAWPSDMRRKMGNYRDVTFTFYYN